MEPSGWLWGTIGSKLSNRRFLPAERASLAVARRSGSELDHRGPSGTGGTGDVCLGQIDDDSREVYLAVIGRMAEQQIDGIILGCTEIGLLLQQQHCHLKLYDTTAIHAERAVTLALDRG